MELRGARIWVTGAPAASGPRWPGNSPTAGASSAISARNADELHEVAAGRMHVEPVDVTDRTATVAAGAAVREALGGLDVAVLNAGTWSRFRPEQWDSQAFADQLQTNLMGTVHALEAVVPTMIADGRGRIVGTASVAGYRGIPGAEAYGATKAALLNLFEALRGTSARAGSSSRRVAPGFVKTPMTDRNTSRCRSWSRPRQAARAIADGIVKDKAEIVFPLPMMLLDEGRPAGAGTRLDGRDARP